MSLFTRLVESVNELAYSDIMRKQKSVTKLFPAFRSRVAAVNANGGIELVNQFPEVWQFKVASGTKPGIQYDVYVHFLDIQDELKRFASDRRLWNKAKTGVDYRLLAAEMLNKINIKTDCSCPADTFWGPEFIKTKRTAQFGKEEDRPPRIRNPRQYGILCKHGSDVFELLPMYTSTFAKFLKDFYKDDIDKIITTTQGGYSAMQKAAAALGKRRPDVAPKEVTPEEEPKTEETPKEVPPKIDNSATAPGSTSATTPLNTEKKPDDKGKYKPKE